MSCAAPALCDNIVGDTHVVTAQSSFQNIPEARVVALDHMTKAKIARAERDFNVERQRNFILVARVESLEIDLYDANKKIADADD